MTIKIAVSACLLGQKVRYDGKDKNVNLKQYFNAEHYQLLPICPEVEMGMSIPRPSIEVRIIDDNTRLVQVDDHALDFTQQLKDWFDDNIKRLMAFQAYILKSKSPSCGNQTTPHFFNNEKQIIDDGQFVRLLKKINPRVTIIDEIQLSQPKALKAFKAKLKG
jgi:uncharacterized protein YbbK (DUF523 family)